MSYYNAAQSGNYTVVITSTTNGCSATSAPYYHTAIGMEELLGQNAVKVFPNPSTSEFTIENAGLKIKKVELYNTVGEKVFEKHLSSDIGHLTIRVADFPPGIYFITITDQSGNKVTKKVVKMQ